MFLVGPVELETWPSGEIDTISNEFVLHQAPSPDDLVALLAAADVFVGNDAGPTHLAALLGTPTVAVFGATAARVWHPLGPAVRVLEGKANADTTAGWPAVEVVAGLVAKPAG